MTVDSLSDLRSFKNQLFFCVCVLSEFLLKFPTLTFCYASFPCKTEKQVSFFFYFLFVVRTRRACEGKDPVEMVYVAQNSGLLRPRDDSGH